MTWKSIELGQDAREHGQIQPGSQSHQDNSLNGVSKQTAASASLAYALSNKGTILDLFLRDPGSNVVKDGRKKLREEQTDTYRASIAAMPGYPEAHFHLGRVYADLGRPDQALDEMDSYQRLMGDRKAAPAPDAESVAVKVLSVRPHQSDDDFPVLRDRRASMNTD